MSWMTVHVQRVHQSVPCELLKANNHQVTSPIIDGSKWVQEGDIEMDLQIKDSTMETSSVEGLKMGTMDLSKALDLIFVENGVVNSVRNLVQVTTGVSAHPIRTVSMKNQHLYWCDNAAKYQWQSAIASVEWLL
uniref:Uncharacterized protein n=1 Tax=Opuntia streptacantha TaxID=393608 RepID=A0A7C9F0R0_OPUST